MSAVHSVEGIPGAPAMVRHPMPGVVYPPAALLRRYVDAGVLAADTLPGALAESFARHAERVALAGPEGNHSYRELDNITDRLGGALLALGLAPLDRVIFQIANCNELLFGFVACLKAGLIPICTLAAHREQEIGYLGNHAAARLHFVQGDDPKFDDVAFAEKMRAAIPSVGWILQARGPRRGTALSLADLVGSIDLRTARARLADVTRDPFQVAVFQLSGGTTGVPKIIPRFHNEYVYNMRAVAHWLGYRPDDCLFMPMPMMHNLNMGCCFGPFLLCGGTVTVAPNLTPETLVAIFRTCSPTWAVLAGPIVAKLKPAIDSGALPLDRLRGVIAATGAPGLRQVLGAPVYHIFGMTEGVIMLTREGDPAEVIDLMHGRPVSEWDEVKLLKPGTEEEIVAAGVEGESVFRGPYTIHGYFDAPERDRDAFTRDGFYRSGDLMLWREIDGKRYYQFRGRTKDVVDRANEKVNCEEVELAVNRNPAIVATAVVGMPDPVYGERVCAFVIVHQGAAAPTVPELGVFLREVGIAKFKWPERIEVVADFPVTRVGKVDKQALRTRIAEQLVAERGEQRRA